MTVFQFNLLIRPKRIGSLLVRIEISNFNNFLIRPAVYHNPIRFKHAPICLCKTLTDDGENMVVSNCTVNKPQYFCPCGFCVNPVY